MPRQRHDSGEVERLGRWLRECREAAGLTQGELAQAIGLSSGRFQVGHWEDGQNVPDGIYLLAMFQALGVEVSALPVDPPRAVNSELRELRRIIEGKGP